MKKDKNKITGNTASHASSCDICEYYDYNEESEQYECNVGVNMDEDEMASFLGFNTKGCPYFKLYDEYKSVQKQN